MKTKHILQFMLSLLLFTFTAFASDPILGVRVNSNGTLLAPTNFFQTNLSAITATLTSSLTNLNYLPFASNIIPTNAVYNTNDPILGYIAYGPFALQSGYIYTFTPENENEYVVDDSLNAIAGAPPFPATFTNTGETLFIIDINGGHTNGQPVLAMLYEVQNRVVAASGTFLGTFSGDGSGLSNLPGLQSANNLSDLSNHRDATTNEGLAIFHIDPANGYASFSNDLYNASARAKFTGQMAVSDGPQPWLTWSTATNGAPISIMNGIAIGDLTHMPFDPNMFADNRTYWRFQGNPGYASAVGTNAATNWCFSTYGPVIENLCPYGAGSGMWFNPYNTNGAGGVVRIDAWGLFIGVNGDQAWEGFGPHNAHITPDAGWDVLIDSPVGYSDSAFHGSGTIAPLNHFVFASQFANRACGFPYWIPGVTRPNVSSNEWMFYLKEDTGKIYATNSHTTLFLTELQCGNIIVTNSGSITATSANFTGGIVTNNGICWLTTNNTPSIPLPNGSICTVTDGRQYYRSNNTWNLH